MGDPEQPTNAPGQATVSRNNMVLESNISRRKRTTSCPPGVNRSVVSGLWRMDWLNDHNPGDAMVIFSTKKDEE